MTTGRPVRPDLPLLRLYLAVLDAGGIGAAARAVGMTQPAASMALRRLERQIGVQLLQRTPRGTRPSPSGLALAESARELLRAADRFEESVEALRAGAGECLRIMAGATLADHIVPDLLGRLWSAAPLLRVTLLVGTGARVTNAVLTGEVDLGFVAAARIPDGLWSRQVGVDRLTAIVPRGHPWATRGPVYAADLVGAPMVLRERGSSCRAVFDAALGAAGLRCDPHAELSSDQALKGAVLAGAGVGVISDSGVRDEVALGTLVALPVADLDLRRLVHAVWQPGSALAGRAVALLANERTDERADEPGGEPANEPGGEPG